MPKRSAFSEVRLLLLAALAISGLSYATNIFLANAMGPSVFGQYAYVLLLGGLFGQVIFFGTDVMGVRLKTSHGDPALEWIFTLKLINFVLLLGGALASALIGGVAAPLLAMIVALNSLSYSTHYETQGRNVRYATIFLVERVSITASLWLGLLILDSSYLVWIFTTIAIVQGGSLLFQYSENRQYRLTLDLGALKIAYRESFFVLVLGLSKFLFGGTTRIIIFNQLGDERMGVFATAWQFVPLGTLYFAQATKAWRLRITEALDAKNARVAWDNIQALAIVVLLPTLCVAVALFFEGDRIIALLFSADFGDAGQMMPYVGAYLVVVGFDSFIVLLAIAMSMNRLVSIVYLVFGGITTVVCLSFTGGQGLEAYFAAIIIGHFCASATLAVFTTRAVRRSLRPT